VIKINKEVSNQDLKRIQYLDNREYQSKFLLDPDIKLEEDFNHLDKNLAITNLKDQPKLKIDEVNESRAILRGLHILNNRKHYQETKGKKLIGYMDKEEKGEIKRIPVFEDIIIKKSNFPKTFHAIRSEFISLTNTSAARNGHRIKAAITNRLEKVESLQDKTKNKSRWGFNNKY